MKSRRSQDQVLENGLILLYEDPHIFVVDKPPGLLTIATDKERTRTAYHILTAYVRREATHTRGPERLKNRIFIVHRLDRETSGLLVFARTSEAKQRLQNGWEETRKTYLAVVHGTPEKPEAVLTSCLMENKAHVVYSTSVPGKGKLARTGYKVIRQAKGMSLLEVDLITGRKHQIRVQLADIGHPIVGDRKYGKPSVSKGRMGLHAMSLSFPHPATGEQLSFETKVPAWFTNQVGSQPHRRTQHG